MARGSEAQAAFELTQVVLGRVARLRVADGVGGSSLALWAVLSFGLSARGATRWLRGIEADADATRMHPHGHAVTAAGDLNIRREDGEWWTRGAHEAVWMRTLGRLIHVAGRTPARFEASPERLPQIDHVFAGMPRSVFVRMQLQTNAEDPQAAHAVDTSDHSAVRLLIGGAVDMPPHRHRRHRDIVRSER